MTRDLRTSIYLTSNSAKNVRENWAWAGTAGATSGCNGKAAVKADGAAVEADAIGEQELKWTQSGSSSRSGHNQGALEEDEIREQQLKQMQAASSS